MATYGMPGLPIAVAAVPVAVYLAPLYSSEKIGLSLTAIGAVIMLSRLWDGVSDPLIGYISDRWQSPIGRRKPWLLLGTPLTMVGVFQLFVPPEGASLWYFGLWIVVFYTGWTMVTLPFGAWGAELSDEYAERSRVTAYREAWQLAGTVISVIVPAVALVVGITGYANITLVLAWTVMIVFPICVVVPCLFVPDVAKNVGPPVDIRKGFRVIWSNGPFKRLLIAFAIQGMGRQFVAILFVLYTTHVIGAPDASVLVLGGYFLAGIVGIPIWVKIADRIGKHKAWLYSMFVYNVPLACAMPLGEGDIVLFTILATFAGLSVAAGTVLPLSMKADVIDIDTLRSGKKRAGLFFALWGIADKFSVALAAFVALSVLELSGFSATIDNAEPALFTLSALYLLAPSVFSIVAAALIWNYPVTSERHQRIRARLEKRNLAREKAASALPD